MTRRKLLSFEEWEAEQMKDPEFRAWAKLLEPAFQVTRLRIERGLTQAQLAKLVGTSQPSIARLENGSSIPSLSFLSKIAAALDATIDFKIVPNETSPQIAEKRELYK